MWCARCVWAVRTEMKSCFAISWLVWPSASSRSTSLSRSESGSSSARLRSSDSAATRRAPGSPALLRLGGDEAGPELGMHVAPAGGDLAHRLHDLVVGGLLEDVAAGAGGERLAHVLRVVLHRKHADLHVRALLEQRRDRLDAALLGHHHVQQDHVRLGRARLEDRLARAAGLADGLEVVLGLQHEPQTRADDGVVVHDQDARAQTGTSAATVVPLVAVDSTASVPSSSSIRSRMPTSPIPPSARSVGSNPLPSSSITALILPSTRVTSTLTCCAQACLTTFVSASWTIR